MNKNIEKSLIIHGPFNDLGDLLAVARAEGCKILSSSKINVSPKVFCFDENSYVVVVSPKNELVVQTPHVVCGNGKSKP